MPKILVVSTHFKDDLEKATLPWVVANAALAEDKEVIVFLQGPSVEAAKKEASTGLQYQPFPALNDLIASYVEAGGKILLCGPCMQAHSVAPDQLIDGAEAAGAAMLVSLAEESAATFAY